MVLFRVIHDKSGTGLWGATFLYKMFSSTLSRRERASVKFLKWDRFISPLWRNTREYRTIVVVCFFPHQQPPHTVISCLIFYFCRQVQRLRNLKGAKCEEHHHQRPWGPAMLGAGLHVVSVIAPVSPVCVLVTRISSALGVYCSEFMLDNVYLWLNLHVGWGDSSS